jgi:multidrug resistance efflux pump
MLLRGTTGPARSENVHGAPRQVARLAGAAILLTTIACGAAPSTQESITEPVVAPTASLRLSGTVEAVQTTAVAVPRLQGPLVPLLIVGLVEPGTRVEAGQPLVEFDRQQQERDAFDRRAELVTLDSDIAKKRAEQAAAEAKDQTELTAAEHDVERALLEVRKNELIPAIEAEKNTLALEQARARFAQLKTTFTLKRQAAMADLRIVEIRRERAQRALTYAENNARLMMSYAPFGGLVVAKRLYRNGQFVEIARGDEVRPGTPVVDIVDTSRMRVRARVNQVDASAIRVGQDVTVGLDGFPELAFPGRVVGITPLASTSGLSPTVRNLTALVSIDATHPQLLPDLTAWVDVPPLAPATMAEAAR